MAKLPNDQANKRGITVDGTLFSVSCIRLQCSLPLDHLRMLGAPSIFALGDCTSTSYAPTAQVASQQGAYLARILKLVAQRDALEDQVQSLSSVKDGEKLDDKTTKRIEKLKKKNANIRLNPFKYSHQGSLAYVLIVHRLHTLTAFPSYIGSDKAIADLPIFGREVRRPLFRSLNFYERRFSGPAEARPHIYSGEVPI